MIYIKGNLLKSPFQIIAHQVNCYGVMGAGVAKQIKEIYPENYQNYKSFVDDWKEDAFGKCCVGYCKNGKKILNLFGQMGYGYGENFTNYDKLYCALKDGINQIKNDNFKEDGIQLTIAIPYKMGAGLAGGDWNKIVELLKRIEREENVVFIAYKLDFYS